MLIDAENSTTFLSEVMDRSAAHGTEAEHNGREVSHSKAMHRRRFAMMHVSATRSDRPRIFESGMLTAQRFSLRKSNT
jgi:hypothetical protein